MMTAADLAEIARIRNEIRADRPASIALRRGDATLAAQEARIARLSSGSRFRSESGAESRGGILVSGAAEMDIALDDRFTLNGAVYRIKFVRPNRDTGTQAEAELVQ
ncbi:MAG TPA: hypothetical protein DCG54_07600 [Anaerolineae bacterium]|jgi:hypothetical protein|nr:hypothetical protein [Anaerolineae bacterium]